MSEGSGKEGKDMPFTEAAHKEAKPIPKTNLGLTTRQKDIMKQFIGKAPTTPVNLNQVRDWEKYGDR
ncbi:MULTISPECIES: hypothetical protein [Paenibacillus]|uniref:Uncharacterized protein n=1 Tax=Paenibacillus chondroitinus TaxID=59842 RepID=A0ABU6DMP4_9BACL|nr:MULTISPECIES: hypothetical protein [Paenibacillus]MCY9662417.1 hypothetical protein [Paenibacillus anseongense]MEB4798590.1 hypothetical protein [Paenibacillus chondroitinus]